MKFVAKKLLLKREGEEGREVGREREGGREVGRERGEGKRR